MQMLRMLDCSIPVQCTDLILRLCNISLTVRSPATYYPADSPFALRPLPTRYLLISRCCQNHPSVDPQQRLLQASLCSSTPSLERKVVQRMQGPWQPRISSLGCSCMHRAQYSCPRRARRQPAPSHRSQRSELGQSQGHLPAVIRAGC